MDFLFFTIYVANEINRQRRLAFLWHWVVVQYSFSPLKKYIFTRLLISSKNCYCRRRNVVRSCLANGFCCVCLLILSMHIFEFRLCWSIEYYWIWRYWDFYFQSYISYFSSRIIFWWFNFGEGSKFTVQKGFFDVNEKASR